MPLIHADEEEVQLRLAYAPASIQAKKQRRDQIAAELRTITAGIPILFSGDVGVTIQLWRSEQEHYETDRAADIDNLIKPILDGLVGPDGVMIDDNQVQNVQCYWIQHLEAPAAVVTIDSRLREHVEKQGLVFIHMGKQLYFPFDGNLPKEITSLQLKMLALYQNTRKEREGEGRSYHEYRYFMPVQRYFHKTRLAKFRCVEFEDAQREFG